MAEKLWNKPVCTRLPQVFLYNGNINSAKAQSWRFNFLGIDNERRQ